MTTARSGVSGRRAASIVAALLLGVAALFVALVASRNNDSGAEVPPTDELHAPPTIRPDRPRVRPETPESMPATAPAVAVDERGQTLVGMPAPGEIADPSVTYRFISVMAADGTSELAALRPDHEGKFVLSDDLRDKRLRLFAMSERDATPLEHPLVVKWEDIAGRSVIFVAPRIAGQVTIRCVDDTGVGIRGRVTLERRFGEDWRTLRTLETGSDGLAVTEAAGLGEYRARLKEASTRSKIFVHPLERLFTVASDSPVAVEFVLPRAAEIVARVVDENGRPVAGALVNVHVKESGQFRPHPQGRRVDTDGQVRISGIEPGAVILQATQLGRVPVIREFDAQPGVQEQVFTLVPGGARLTGRFAGLPDTASKMEFAELHLLRVSDVTRDAIVLFGAKLTTDWSFDIEGVPAGRYQLTLKLPGIGNTMVWCNVPETGASELGTIDLSAVLSKGSRELGVRVEADPPTTEFAPTVLYRRSDWPEAVWRPVSLWLGETARVQDLVEGTYKLRLSPQAYDPEVWDLSATTTVTFDSDATARTAVLRIRRK